LTRIEQQLRVASETDATALLTRVDALTKQLLSLE
jgi:hypothetical protein